MEGRGPVARTRCGKAGSGLRAGTRLSQALQHVRANARQDRDKSRMRESRMSGSVRGDGASRTPTSTALLRGLDILLGEVIGIPVIVAEDPMSCVAIGTGQRAILSR